MRTKSFLILMAAGLAATGLAIGDSAAGGFGRRQACVASPVVLVGEAAVPAPVAVAPMAAAADEVPANRKADDAAIRKALDGFAASFQKGDAKAVAANWTEAGEYVDDENETLRGRAEIEKAYAEFYKKYPVNALTIEVDSVRFPSKDNAVVEGHFKLQRGKNREWIASRCSFLFAREDGAWKIAIAREWPADGATVRDLEWLIGTWETKKNGAEVTTKYEWTANKTFIRCTFTVKEGKEVQSGTQMIGKDPATGGLRVWTFEDTGGIGDSTITRDGKKWVYAAHGTTSEGKSLTATNIMTPVDADTFLWQSVERTLDEQPLADVPPVKVTRVKAGGR